MMGSCGSVSEMLVATDIQEQIESYSRNDICKQDRDFGGVYWNRKWDFWKSNLYI